ncbi:MAG: translocation/assembly module TamB [Treponema sp.]|nr:translocation/assembly module TamB [Treponema sp.]
MRLRDLRNNQGFRLAVETGIFLLLISITVLAIRPLQLKVQERMRDLRDYAFSRCEEYLGLRIEYDAMGPGIFGSLDIRNIRVYRNAPEALLKISRLCISYSLWDLLRGRVPDAFTNIRVDNPEFTLNMDYDEKLGELMAKFNPAAGEGLSFQRVMSLIPQSMTVRLRRGSCSVLGGAGSVRVNGISLDIEARENLLRLRSKLNAQGEVGNLFGQSFNMRMAGIIDGTIDTEQGEGRLNIIIPSLMGDKFSMKPVQFAVLLNEQEMGLVKLTGPAQNDPLDLSARYEFAAKRFSAAFRADNFSLRSFFSLSGPLRAYNSFLGFLISGNASFETAGEGGFTYAVDVQGSFDSQLPAGKIVYGMNFSGDEQLARCQSLSLALSQGVFFYTGEIALRPFAPNGTLRISDFSLTGAAAANAELTVNSQGRSITIFGDKISLGPVELSGLDMEIIQEAGGLAFRLFALRFTDIESYERVQVSRITFDGSLDRSPRYLRGSVILDAVSASDILDMLRPFCGLPEFAPPVNSVIEGVSLTTEVFITTDFRQVLYNAPRFVAAYQGVREVFALVSVSGTDRRFEVTESRIVWADNTFTASGFADFTNPADSSFSLQASYRNASYFLNGAVLDGQTLSIQGSYGFSAYIGRTVQGEYSGYIEARSFPIPFQGQLAQLSFLCSLRYTNADLWTLDLTYLDVVNARSPVSPISSLRVSGVADQDGALFHELFLDDGLGVLAGRAQFSWNRRDERLTGRMQMGNQEQSESYELELDYRNGALDARFWGANIRLDRITLKARNALASGELSLRWESWESYRINLDLSALSIRVGDTDGYASARGALDPQTLQIQDLQLRYGGFQITAPQLRINLADSRALAESRIQGALFNRELDLTLQANIAFAPISSWFSIARILDSFHGVVQAAAIRFNGQQVSQAFTFTVERDSSLIAVSGGPEDMLRFSLAQDGAFYANLAYPSPVRGVLTGSLTTQFIDAQTSNLYVDLVSLWRFVPQESVVVCTGGFVNASLRIRGPLRDPEFFGAAQGSSVRLRVPQFVSAEIGPATVAARFEGNEMRFGPLQTAVGSGSGEITAWFRFDRWIPNNFNLDIRSAPEAGIPFSLDIEGVVAKGTASGDLRIAMADNALTVKGDITGRDAEITLNTDELAVKDAGPSAIPVITDFTITTDRKVEFFWPSSDVPILRAQPELGTKIAITGDTGAGAFSLDGEVSLRSGEIFYVQRSFYIRQGVLSFNENENQFDPRITIRAETRDRTNDGPVTIAMLVDNAPLLSFTARFESSPPLSQMEISALLGQNLTGVSSGGGDARQTAFIASGGDMMMQFIVVRRMERIIREVLHLDMFSLRTQILQNLAAAAAVQVINRDEDSVDKPVAIGNYFDNTTVFLGKYLSPHVFLQGMGLFRYDERIQPLKGLIRTNNGLSVGGVVIEPNFGIEMHGPGFDIGWSITPLHVENLFVNDMSISITKRWSF